MNLLWIFQTSITVQVFGTEDRVTDKAKTVAPSTQIIPFVTFPGQEIKDLYVHETSAPPAPAPASAAHAPPAPPAHTGKTGHDGRRNDKPSHQTQQSGGRGGSRDNRDYRGSAQGQSQSHTQSQQGARPRDSGNRDRKRDYTSAGPSAAPPAAPAAGAGTASTGAGKVSEVGTGGHLLKLRERRTGTGAVTATVETAGEFDFEGGLKTFNKDEVLAEVAVVKTEVHKYSKDDFFDNFSKTTGADTGTKARLTAAEERRLNADTFGAIALQSNHRRGGGRGRGGYGRGRGGGYGGRGRGRGRGQATDV